ncbi:MAG: VOC family protein [Eubacteriaceae bacterium]|jgi:lactoylglutathione lyase
MRIDHISMFATRPEEVKAFYVKYFGATPSKEFIDTESGLPSYYLTFDDGSRVEILNRPEITRMAKNHIDLGYIRVSYMLDSREEVDKLANRLQSDGYAIIQQPKETPDGFYDCVVLDPDDNQIVIMYGDPENKFPM